MTIENLRAAIADLEHEREQIKDRYFDGEITGEQAARFDKDIQQEIDDCLHEIALWLEHNKNSGLSSSND